MIPEQQHRNIHFLNDWQQNQQDQPEQ